jgi:Chlorophyll A-B binding protein
MLLMMMRARMRTQICVTWLILLVTNLTCAFRPPSIRDELGCSPTLSVLLGRVDWRSDPAFFDPLQVANDGNFARLREGELKCGRVAMIAMVETIMMPVLNHYHLSDDEIPTMVTERISQVAPMDVIKVMCVCGILETVVFVQRSPKDLPGDDGTGWFGKRDKGQHETLLIAELEHGRLAMMAIVLHLSLERLLDQPWDQYWIAWVKHWINQL